MKHTEIFRVGACDMDMDGRLSVSAILRFAQDTANCQHEVFGPKTSDLRCDGKAFVISRVSADIENVRDLNCKRISVTTWINQIRGFVIERNTVITDGERPDGRSLASITAVWGLMDLENRRPVRADTLKLGFTADDDIITTKTPIRFPAVSDDRLSRLGTHTVSFSDCDENRHMNNTVYPSLFIDITPPPEDKYISGLAITYKSEARYGRSFDIFGTTPESTSDPAFFKTVFEDGTTGAETMFYYSDK